MIPPSTSPASAVTLLATVGLAALLAACFDSDELLRSNNETESGGDTITMYSDETAESGDDSWTAEETGPAETTCRDAIDCLVTCQTMLILSMDPEPDLGCFFDCDQGLTLEEAYLLITLGECIGNKCAMDPDGPDGPMFAPCGPESSDNDCLICIAANGQDPQPIGCEEEAAACD